MLFSGELAPNKIKENLGDFKENWDKLNEVIWIPLADIDQLNLDVIKEESTILMKRHIKQGKYTTFNL